MSLTDLWINSREQLDTKHVQQIIAWAGRLRDGGEASRDFREFLSHVPSSKLSEYMDQCLRESFQDSGYALQDLVNQIGRRLGFKVTDGRYRGSSSQPGYDGLWCSPGGHTVIIEVKTTDVYQIALDTLARYRRELINSQVCTDDDSSILIVLGRADKNTNDLEAQIRGSRHAWYVRLISVEALLRLMVLKEEVDDPKILGRIAQILIPREYTKLDEIIDLVFFTAEDVRQDEVDDDEEADEMSERPRPVAFYEACIKQLEKRLGQTLVKQTRTSYSSPDDTTRLALAISKPYERSGLTTYWFAFHPHQKEYIAAVESGYVAFGCGSAENLVVIPHSEFATWLEQMHTTERKDRFYWHVNIAQDGNSLTLHRKRGATKLDITKYRV